MPVEMAPQYDPKQVEDRLYAWWEKSGFFKADTQKALAERRLAAKEGRAARVFSLVIPPPNITGILTVGHVLDNTPQDICVRYHRMKGEITTWIPGTDHAGIATQNVVVKALAKEGVKREDLGREKFIERVWAWKGEYGDRIVQQLRKLGCSCDWDRLRFTMDEGCSRAVTEIFCRLYEKGLLYRGDYLVNWCPKCRTALSDEEVEHFETNGSLWHLRYPRADGKGHVIVATTRPETMLGDTAVAVHPDDPRYRDLVGKSVTLPLQNRPIPVIADSYVDPKFGTGAVKVTPAHDPNDFAIRERHREIGIIDVMTDDGRMSSEAGSAYAGLSREECRKKVVADLEAQGFLEKIEPHKLNVGRCYRCDVVVEPRKSLQWFVKMQPLAAPALKAAQTGDLKFFPARWLNTYTHWMENIRDWCVSRQLWWGHRIPVWYCDCGQQYPEGHSQSPVALADAMSAEPLAWTLNDGRSGKIYNSLPAGSDANEWMCFIGCQSSIAGHEQDDSDQKHPTLIVSRRPPKVCPSCKRSDSLHQDPDVLDTWFSSWLWPFSTLGWPEKTDDLEAFYPTSWLNSGKDILFFWDARMVMAGLFATEKLPFSRLYLHGIARDAQGRKISKSLGNSPDPLALFEKYSADALRFGIIANTPLGADVQLTDKIYELGRNFCNKLWNASRFVMQATEKVAASRRARAEATLKAKPVDAARFAGTFYGVYAFEDEWIRQRFTKALDACNRHLDASEFGEAAQTAYHFMWDDFCDWYLELIKTRLYRECATDAEFDDQGAAAATAMLMLENTVRILHPFVPFVTEEIWQHLRRFWTEVESAAGCEWRESDLREMCGSGGVSDRKAQRPDLGFVNAQMQSVRREFQEAIMANVGRESVAAVQAELHPVGGFPARPETIMFGPWPKITGPAFEPDAGHEATMERLQGVIRGVRDIRNKMNLKPPQVLAAVVNVPNEETRDLLERHRGMLATHGKLDPLTIGIRLPKPPRSATAMAGSIEICVPLGDLVDWKKERVRLEGALAKAKGGEASVLGKLGNANFKANAPAEIVAAEEARLAECREQIRALDGSLRELAEWEKA